MKREEPTPKEPLAQRVYRWSLMVYPRSYRERDAMGMQYAFTRQLREASERGKVDVALFWLRTVLHAVLFGLSERMSQARRRLPGPYRDRRTRGTSLGREWIRRVAQEIRHAVRRLARRPTLTVTVMLSLALGIGASTAVFSLVYAVLIEPLPFPESGRLVGVWHTDPVTPKWGHSQISYLFYRQHNHVFEDMGVYRSSLASITEGEAPEELSAALVSASTLGVLGVDPQLGRGFLEEEQHPGAAPTVVLSHRLWIRRFGANPGILGRTVQIDGTTRTVIGVMPAEFQFPNAETQLWLPMEIDEGQPDGSYWNCSAVARLLPGVDISQAQVEMKALAQRISEAYPDPESAAAYFGEIRLSAVVHPFKEDVVGDVSVALWILFAVVGCVLLIAYANSANPLLVSAEERLGEVALRTALGASRAALLLTFLTESTLLAVGGGALGLGLANVSTPAILALLPQGFPRLESVGISGPVLLFTLGTAIFGGLLLGFMPSLHRIPSPASALQAGGYRVAGGLKHRYAQNGLAVTQLALALILMTGSALMLRSFHNIRSVEPGFESDEVLTFSLRVPEDAYGGRDETLALYDEVLEHVRAVPGVVAAGAASSLPLAAAGRLLGHSFEDFPPGVNEHLPNYVTVFAMPGYFEALQIPLVAGRAFDRADLGPEARVVVVSAPLAERLWPHENPVGKRLTPARFEDTGTWYEIAGVAGPVRHDIIEAPPTEVIYYPMRPLYFSADADPLFSETLYFAVRADVSANTLTGPVSAAVWSVIPNVPITRIRTLRDIVAQASARTTFTLTLLAVAAGVALVLGLMGLYGLISYVVSRRRREIGIRMALGADSGMVNRMVLGSTLRLACWGLMLGLAGTLASARFLRSLLYEVSATDPLTIAIVSFLLLATALTAGYLPARRAARVHPVESVAGL
jgi:putative ABC transport system permease protein